MRLRRTAYFSASAFAFSIIVAAVTNTPIDLQARARAAGWDGVSPVSCSVVIELGAVLYSQSPNTPAITDAGFPAGSRITLAVRGGIYGAGGYGGATHQSWSAYSGGTGGTAVRLRTPTVIDCTGTLAGGGGATGYGYGQYGGVNYSPYGLGGNGGQGEGYNSAASSGTAGSTGIAYHNGDPVVYGYGGVGGPGGALGSAGYSGGAGNGVPNFSSPSYLPGAGGLAGAYIDGAAYVTWTNTGARLGQSI